MDSGIPKCSGSHLKSQCPGFPKLAVMPTLLSHSGSLIKKHVPLLQPNISVLLAPAAHSMMSHEPLNALALPEPPHTNKVKTDNGRQCRG